MKFCTDMNGFQKINPNGFVDPIFSSSAILPLLYNEQVLKKAPKIISDSLYKSRMSKLIHSAITCMENKVKKVLFLFQKQFHL